MFLTKALKMAKAEADGLRKEKTQAESRADMAETAVREARGGDFTGHGAES